MRPHPPTFKATAAEFLAQVVKSKILREREEVVGSLIRVESAL
jgi:hypothetical protein